MGVYTQLIQEARICSYTLWPVGNPSTVKSVYIIFRLELYGVHAKYWLIRKSFGDKSVRVNEVWLYLISHLMFRLF